MISKIVGTARTQNLIGNIINDFRKNRPLNPHLDYSIRGKHFALLTEENGGEVRNVSLLYFNGIKAAIGNNTGALLLREKPWYMSKDKAKAKIIEFLESIQPQNLTKTKQPGGDSCLSFDKCSLLLSKNYFKMTQELESAGQLIEKSIVGSNNLESGEECIKAYKTL